MGSTAHVHLRRYVTEDLDAVVEVFQRAIREVACRDYDPAQIAAWSAVDRDEWEQWRLTRPTWIADIDGQVVGFSDLEADGHLDMMFVHPDHQGRGIATLLLAAVEAAAREQGLTTIFTEASVTARSFFARRGFVLDKQDIIESDGERFVIFRMAKSPV